MVAAAGLCAPSKASAEPLFGTIEFRAGSLSGLPQWQRTLRQIDGERAVYATCRRNPSHCPSAGAAAWLDLIAEQKGRSPIAQVDAVNRFLNAWQYRSDIYNYGRRDYWATPLEFLRRSGDCEDYAIAKYVTLRELGFDAEQLRVVVVRDTERDLAHAVLAVYLDEGVFILDNLSDQLLRQGEVSRYAPYYSINEHTRWAHVLPLDPAEQQIAPVAGSVRTAAEGHAPS